MAGIVECVPNFSEGRDAAVVDAIVGAMAAVPGVRLLDHSMDAGHNRAVVSIIGSPDAVAESAFRGVAEAVKSIDLRSHKGEHPRMGAADVVPFIPIRGISTEECVRLARQVGERIGKELSVPVFLYEDAATRPERRNLAEVRAPQFEGLRELIGIDPARDPDFGPSAIHPTAGAVAVGCRHLLVAYNVYLSSSDQGIATAIAKAVRFQTGGLRYVKALGIGANEAGRVHVSMNLTNTDGTPIHRALELIRSEAARRGVSVVESEIVGLVSADALLDAAEHYLQLNSFSRSQVLEYRLLESLGDDQPGVSTAGLMDGTVREYADRVASGVAAPGGGSVSALVGALSSALVTMVARLTAGRKRFADRDERMRAIEARAEELRASLTGLASEDALAYTEYMAARKRVRSGDESARTALRESAWNTTRVPLLTARAALEAMVLAREVCETGNPVARTDGFVAALAAHAAVLGACQNVRVNLPSLIAEQHPDELEAEAGFMESRAAGLLSEVLSIGRSRPAPA